MSHIDNMQDTIDVRDLIARVEELRETSDALREEFDSMPENDGVDFATWVRNQVGFSSEEYDELLEIEGLLDEVCSYGGDEWYPVTLIRDSYFTDYARGMLEDCGDIPKGIPSYIEIDWEATACNIRVDYSSVEIDDVPYWYR
jgi:hypothetical protein